MNNMDNNKPLPLPPLSKEQREKQNAASRRFYQREKERNPDFVNNKVETNKRLRKKAKNEGRLLRRSQMIIPHLAQPASVANNVVNKIGDTIGMMDRRMAGMTGFGNKALTELSSIAKKAYDKAPMTVCVAATGEEVTEAVEEEEAVVCEKEPKIITDHAFQLSFERGVTYHQMVDTLTHGKKQGIDTEKYSGTHKVVGKEATLVVTDSDPLTVVSTWPNKDKQFWMEAPCPPEPCLGIKDGESPKQFAKRLAKEMKAMQFWKDGQTRSRFLSELAGKDAALDRQYRQSADEIHMMQRHIEELEEKFHDSHTMDMQDLNELQYQLDCERHALDYFLHRQSDSATEPVKKRQRVN